MLKVALSLTIGLLATTPVYGENHNGDATKGEAAFKKCKACHGIIADNGKGDVIIKGGKTGPNLWGVIGRQAGTYPEYKYGKSIVAAGNAGFLWDENGFLAYIKYPQKFLKEKLNDTKAKSKMAFKMKRAVKIYWPISFRSGHRQNLKMKKLRRPTKIANDSPQY